MLTKSATFPRVAIAGLALLLATVTAQAAVVPPGAKLAPAQELVRGNGTEPATLDPNKMQGVPESNLARDLFEGLVNQDPDGKIIPGVAASWEAREGGKVWVFHLRPNLKWSDGKPLTAADFVFSARRVVDPKAASPYAWYLAKACSVENALEISEGKKPPETLGVKALDERTVEFRLTRPLAFFVSTLSHTTMLPVPKHLVEKLGDRWSDPANFVSNGAYKLVERVVNERIVMVRNPLYWNDARTVVNKVTWLALNSVTAEFQRYRAGEIDITENGGVPTEQIKMVRKEHGNEFKSWSQVGTYYYGFNTKVKPFDDVRVRKALSLLVNREVITKQLLGTGEVPAFSFTPEITSGSKPLVHDWQRMTQKERDAEAAKLIKEAGFGPKNPLRVKFLYNTNEAHKKIALAVESMWRRAGISIELINQEWKTYLDTKRAGNFDVVRAGWVGDYNEPSTMMDMFTTTHGNNDGKYSNPKYDELLDKVKVVPDEEGRAMIYQEAEKILATDFPAAFIYQYSNRYLIKPYVRGYGNNPDGRILTKDLYLVAH